MRLALDIAPSFAFLNLEETKAAIRVEGDEDNDFIASLIEVAAQHIEGREGITRKQFRQASYTARLPVKSSGVEVPLPPLVSVLSAEAVDENEASVALTSYNVQTDAYVGKITAEWPDDALELIVSYTCGYVDEASIPAPVKHAARLLVGHWYENREATVDRQIYQVPMGVRDLLKPFSVPYNRERNG